MTSTVDLNADMGEGIGNDAALLDIVTSANIACGGHAGDVDTMADTMKAAYGKGVWIGAHPGFFDREGFGRARQTLSADQLRSLIAYQLGAALGIGAEIGVPLRHLKLHGALANMAAEDIGIARACFAAARALAPQIVLMAMAGTQQERAARELGGAWVGEVFGDRAYGEDGTLLDRSHPSAVLHDATEAAERIADMVRQSSIVTLSGKLIPTKIDTICVHGDTPEAVEMARKIRARLLQMDVAVAPF
ncbi:LamB/YcsF family protein [Aliiroseovarius sp. PTFE2010]|uniref:LamB/YcsF family protein n=1 Tax=Aliiroseovarius sp. PTFE2010 TaxID=3417190 RepID=UPI003CF8DD0C